MLLISLTGAGRGRHLPGISSGLHAPRWNTARISTCSRAVPGLAILWRRLQADREAVMEEEIATIPDLEEVSIPMARRKPAAPVCPCGILLVRRTSTVKKMEGARGRGPGAAAAARRISGHIRVPDPVPRRSWPTAPCCEGRISAERDLAESWDLLDKRRIARPLERIKGVASDAQSNGVRAPAGAHRGGSGLPCGDTAFRPGLSWRPSGAEPPTWTWMLGSRSRGDQSCVTRCARSWAASGTWIRSEELQRRARDGLRLRDVAGVEKLKPEPPWSTAGTWIGEFGHRHRHLQGAHPPTPSTRSIG